MSIRIAYVTVLRVYDRLALLARFSQEQTSLIIKTPCPGAPRANAIAEWQIASACRECLDRM